MHLAHLSLHDFRSWPDLDLALEPGAVCFVGRNGQGKTNIVEAVDYLARLGSHRVAADAPLVRQGADHAVVRAAVVRDERRASLEVQINPGKSNRAQVNRSPLSRPRELLGWVRTVLFAPDDLVLVKGDPSDRRHFLDDLAVQQQPRYAAVRADYERVLKQRNSLLKTAGAARRGGSGSGQRSGESALATLEVWDQNLARLGAQLVSTRLRLIAALRPHLSTAYAEVARGGQELTTVGYRCSFLAESSEQASEADLEEALLAAVAERRRDELDRGVSLVGPHRDDLLLGLGDLPVKGYASHGESWSYALALRLASFALLREVGDDPILILDDVFAELDSGRRDQLAALAADAEQVLVTAAVEEDVPPVLAGSRYRVGEGRVTHE